MFSVEDIFDINKGKRKKKASALVHEGHSSLVSDRVVGVRSKTKGKLLAYARAHNVALRRTSN